jgi:uncharacterized phiE125 gp8 family phage protein
MNLTTTAKIKSHIGIPSADTSKDSKIATIISGVSAFFEGQCARSFEYKSYSAKLNGNGTDELMLPQYPIHQVTEIIVDDVEIDIDAEVAAKTLDIDQETGILYRTSGWSAGKRNIEITFTAGYTESEESGDVGPIPADLELAVTRMVARIYERSTAEGVSSVSPQSYSVNYMENVDADILATIARYQKTRVL